MKTHKFIKGFMLIELLVVIATILLLASFLIANLMDARQKAQNAKITSEARSVQSALALYFSDYGAYPLLDDYDVHCVTDGCMYENVAPAGATLQSELSAYLPTGAGDTPSINLDISGTFASFKGIVYQCLIPTTNGDRCETAILLIPQYGSNDDVGYGFNSETNSVTSQYAGDVNGIDDEEESEESPSGETCSVSYDYYQCNSTYPPGCGEGWTDGSDCGSSTGGGGEYYYCVYQGVYNTGEGWTDGSDCGSSSESSSTAVESCFDGTDNDGNGDVDGCDATCTAGDNGYCADTSSSEESSSSPVEYCFDGSDNDGDGSTDGCDAECTAGDNGYCADTSSSEESSSSSYGPNCGLYFYCFLQSSTGCGSGWTDGSNCSS